MANLIRNGIKRNKIPINLGFEQSISATGYQILPGGLIFQWGTATGDQGNLGAAYPMAFKERVFQVLLTLNDKTAAMLMGSLSMQPGTISPIKPL
ncbi:gp53-like domain-containing protein [Atlantibacter hermannii]|uniref:gp53-like domain-containing protein n=1 Tax=Atlantibacter hermannii TaxID=565 RepID=UPI00296E4E08|nr:hypothetical protein [Atlantibacter hermannii]MDW4578160.1 hypothetical protein [Atlantibacter hermannii]